MSYTELSNILLYELKYADFKQKQASIVKLFPSFKDRVKKVAGNGGISLESENPGRWGFLVASGTDKSKHYVVTVEFSNIEDVLKAASLKPEFRTRDGNKLDLNKLAREVLFNTDLKLNSDSPSDKWWGFDTIKTDDKTLSYDKNFDPRNHRQPDIRNPNKVGYYGKHVDLVMSQLPFYVGTMAQHLKKFFSPFILELEKEMNKAKYNPNKETPEETK